MDHSQQTHHCHEDLARHWMYSKFNSHSYARSSYDPDQMLYGVGDSLHVDPLSMPSVFGGAYECSNSQLLLPIEQKMLDPSVPLEMGGIQDFSQYPSPESESSSQGCDSYSTCLSDDVRFMPCHTVGSTAQYDLPYFNSPCELGTFDYEYHEAGLFYSALSPELPPDNGGGISLAILQASPDRAFEGNELTESSFNIEDDPDAEGESDHEIIHPAVEDKASQRPRAAPLPDRYDEDSFAESAQDSMSVGYDDPSEEEEDGDYNPRGKKSTGRSRRASAARRSSTNRRSSASTAAGRVTKPKTKRPNGPSGIKFFPCPLMQYGCNSTFTSKNEWKRHVSTQHIKQGYWRCDMCLPTDPQKLSYNDFNRKDLFIQHLRRMHRSHPLTINIPANGEVKLDDKEEPEISDEAVADHQKRCYVVLRMNPTRSKCLFCLKLFDGENSWEERMEHVGSHMESDRKSSRRVPPCSEWYDDADLQEYLQREGLIAFEAGKWRLVVNGKPLRLAENDVDYE